jgi:hypothetical protein
MTDWQSYLSDPRPLVGQLSRGIPNLDELNFVSLKLVSALDVEIEFSVRDYERFLNERWRNEGAKGIRLTFSIWMLQMALNLDSNSFATDSRRVECKLTKDKFEVFEFSNKIPFFDARYHRIDLIARPFFGI